MIKQLFNDVNVPRFHTENLSFENIIIPFKYGLLLFSRFYVLWYKYKGHDFHRAGVFAPVAPPVMRLHSTAILASKVKSQIASQLYNKVFLKFTKFTGKYKCQSLYFNKFAGTATSVLIVLT